jgi:hypothetical protein
MPKRPRKKLVEIAPLERVPDTVMDEVLAKIAPIFE